MSDPATRAEVISLRAEVDQLRAMLAGFTLEVRTQRIVLTDGVRQTEITPGQVGLQHAGEDGEGGTRVSIATYAFGANVIVAEHSGDLDNSDARVAATLYAGSESDPGEAYLSVRAAGVEEYTGVTLQPAGATAS